MTTLLSAAGFDSRLALELSPMHRRRLVLFSWLGFIGCSVCALSLFVGSSIAVESLVVAVAASAVGFGGYWCALLLVRAGGGYPAHAPIGALATWRPAPLVGALFFLVGAMVTQPLVLLSMFPLIEGQLSAQASRHDAVVAGIANMRRANETSVASTTPPPITSEHPHQAVAGLITRSRAAWSYPILASVLTLFFALLFSLPSLLWVGTPETARVYARLRWQSERETIDFAYRHTVREVERHLTRWPGFGGTFRAHFVDPPFNTRPLLFGIETAAVEPVSLPHISNRERKRRRKRRWQGPESGPESDSERSAASSASHDREVNVPQANSPPGARDIVGVPSAAGEYLEAHAPLIDESIAQQLDAYEGNEGNEGNEEEAAIAVDEEDGEDEDDDHDEDDDRDEDDDHDDATPPGVQAVMARPENSTPPTPSPRPARTTWEQQAGALTRSGPLSLTHMDIGEARVSRVRKDLERLAGFIAAVIGESEADVKETLNNRWRIWNKGGVHGGREIKNVFKKWNRLSTVLADGVSSEQALSRGFVPIIAKRLRLSQAEVASRLSAAPDRVPLREVFAAEVASYNFRRKRRKR